MISLIAAMTEERVIGENGKLPWSLPEDLKYFRRVTSGHPVIMGRKTYESIGRLLPNRKNIIISRQANYRVEGASVTSSLESAIVEANKAPGADEVFVIGGGEIYQQALATADRLYITLIRKKFSGDAYFPQFDWSQYEKRAQEDFSEPFSFSFLTLERKR